MSVHRIVFTDKDYYSDLTVEVKTSDNVKIPDETVNKVLGLTMNHLLENMEIDNHESAE